MRRSGYQLVCCLAIAWALDASAYETPTHAEVLTRHAVNRSILQTDPRVLQDLGLKPLSDTSQTFPNSSARNRTVPELLEDGSRFEDSFISMLPVNARFTRHFYNPLTGKGMDEGNFPKQTTSPDWALAPRRSNPDQEFSYWDARQYFLDALTKPSEVDRERSFGLTFRTLGQVIHHLQDMAQPQHVRNDLHCSIPLFCQLVGGVKHAPSFFEKWTNENRGLIAQRSTNPASVGYDITGATFASVFNSPRRFWHTLRPEEGSAEKGKGIAEFTNRNFVSAGTNFDKPQQPSPPFFALPAFDPTKKSETTVKELCSNPNLSPPCPSSMTALPDERITFYETIGHDNFLNAPFTNPRASSESIFDEQLEVQREQRVFASNRFNFDEAYKHLIPRAVAFSAGMINYFFRGKIDLVKDESRVNGYFLQNLGAEPLKGRFALYYDNNQELRKPVPDVNGEPVAWMTEALLVASDGVLAAGGAIPVTLNFDPPTDAKRPNEYMLVFSGNMGEEKAEAGVVGAVAGKLLRPIPYRGALYVSGLDAQNRLVTFKVDTRGLRVLNGPDEGGQIRSTPNIWISPNQTDIDPLHPVVQTFGSTVLPRMSRVKQVAFQNSGLGGMSHQTVALSLGIKDGDMQAYVLDPATDRLMLRGVGMRWTARSTDPAIGEFEFLPTINFDGISGTLNFTRRFRNAANNIQTVGGSIPLPPFPNGVAFRSEDVNYVPYTGFRSGNVVVSHNGLAVSGFKVQTQPEPFRFLWITYDLKVTLGVQPSVSIVQTESVPLRVVTAGPNNINQETQSGPGNNPPDQHFETHRRFINNFDTVENSRRSFVDYINGGLVTWREQMLENILNEDIQDRVQDVVWQPKSSCPFTVTTDITHFFRRVSKTFRTTTVMLDQAVKLEFRSVPKQIGSTLVNYTRNFSSHQVDNFPCSGPGIIGTPVTQDNIVFDADVPTSQLSGFTVQRTLNGRVDGTILQTPPPAIALSFRGVSIGSSVLGYVADASPVGEVFLATDNKNVVVYDPGKSSGIPLTITIPPHIVRILAALWI